MARAIATCTCEHCGATFEKETTDYVRMHMLQVLAKEGEQA